MSRQDENYMRRAIALARKGRGSVFPNPLVGAVIVKDGRVVGEGFHRSAGSNHAEVEALRDAGDSANGADLYVTLEPCNHHGRTPPCTHAIVEAGISRVVVGTRDPNRNVLGGGVEYLKDKGLEVEVGISEVAAEELLRCWSHRMRTGRPFVVVKLAASLDGRIAYESSDLTPNDAPKWISGEVSRAHVQRLRSYADGIMVGSGTALADDPRLTNRSGVGRNPHRILVDSRLSVSINSRMFKTNSGNEGSESFPWKELPAIFVFTTSAADQRKRMELADAGVEVVEMDGEDGKVDLLRMLEHLGELGFQGILCEGGAAIATSLLEQDLVDRLVLYQSPCLIGSEGLSFFDGGSSADRFQALRLKHTRRMGEDCYMVFDRSDVC